MGDRIGGGMPRLRLPRFRNPVLDAIRELARRVHEHTHAIHELKEQIMSSEQEVLADIASAKAALTELSKDVGRVITQLEGALATSNFDTVAAAVADLKQSVQTIDDAVESASPEGAAQPEQPAEPQV